MGTVIERSASFELRDALMGPDDGLTLVGLAAVFNQDTEIDSWEGDFLENIRPGAFRKTIRERTPVLQFDHGRHPLIGSIPIGVIESIVESDIGLDVEARLSDNWLVQPVRDAISERSITGMSFRFEVIRDEWRDNAGKLLKPDELPSLLWDAGDRGPIRRTLIEIKCPELGPVVFPAYAGTSVDVRASEFASQIRSNDGLVRELRQNLARNVDMQVVDVDSSLYSETAKALLFNLQSSNAPIVHDHPLPELPIDAPIVSDHPSVSRIDPTRIKRDADYRRDLLGLILKGSDRYGD